MEEESRTTDWPHLREFRAWALRAAPDAGLPAQRPTEELLAEHHMMTGVVAAMEAEARNFSSGGSLRTEFWARVVDFIGNFVHSCHRAKEEQCFFPAVADGGLVGKEKCVALELEHGRAKDLTLGLCRGVEEGDWEKVLRLVTTYAHFMRPHMRTEELELMQPALRELDAEKEAPLVDAFREVEARTLADRGRRHYLDVARSLCADVGIACPLEEAGEESG